MHCLTYVLYSLCLTARNFGEKLQGSDGMCIFAVFIVCVLRAALRLAHIDNPLWIICAVWKTKQRALN